MHKSIKKNNNDFRSGNLPSQETRERLKAHYIISKELAAASDLSHVANKILKIISNTFDWQAGALWLLNEDSQKMELEEIWSVEDNRFDELKEISKSIKFEIGVGLVGGVWSTGKILWLENISKQKVYKRLPYFKKSGIKSIFIFPLVVSNKVTGVIEFYSVNRRERDMAIISIIATIKNNIAQVVERQKIQREKDIEASKLDTVLASVPFGITVERSSGRITFANQAVAEIFGFNGADVLIGKNLNKIFGKYKVFDEDGIEYKFSNISPHGVHKKLNGMSEVFRFLDKKSKDETWLSMRSTVVKSKDKETNLYIKSYKDITKTLEDQKQRELFVGVVSHEFKNPLASIKAYAQLLKRIPEFQTEKPFNYIENIDNQVNRLTKLINDLLDITRLRSGTFNLNKRKFNIDKTLDKVVQNFRAVSKNYKFIKTGKINMDILADEDRLVQVFGNIIANAVEHSGRGNIVRILCNKEEDFIYITVKDNGVGIAKKYQSEIFKLFGGASNSRKSSNTGMGLSISQAIVKQHGGEILLNSRLGRGAEFIVKIPIN